MPAEGRAADFVERGALATGCCGTLAPEVVVERVGSSYDRIPVYLSCQLLLSSDEYCNVEFSRTTAHGIADSATVNYGCWRSCCQ